MKFKVLRNFIFHSKIVNKGTIIDLPLNSFSESLETRNIIERIEVKKQIVKKPEINLKKYQRISKSLLIEIMQNRGMYIKKTNTKQGLINILKRSLEAQGFLHGLYGKYTCLEES